MWTDVLEERERTILSRIRKGETWQAESICQLLDTLDVMHELMPYEGTRLGIIHWFREGVDVGILTPMESPQAINLCINHLYF